MVYESMPLYPALRPDCGGDACVRFPVFGGGAGEEARPIDESRCRRVWIENPCRPGEVAEVLLSVDGCGNLVVCVRREGEGRRCCRPPKPRPCPPPCPSPCPPPCPPSRPRCDGRRGRLYGSW